MIRDEGVGHSGHGDEGEEGSGDSADTVAKVEETNGEASENDGEVQPGEEGTLVSEEDLGLDARGQGDTLAFGGLVKGWVGGEEQTYQGQLGAMGPRTWLLEYKRTERSG